MIVVQTFFGRLLALIFCVAWCFACNTHHLESQPDLNYRDWEGPRGIDVPSDVASGETENSSTPVEPSHQSQNDTSEDSQNEESNDQEVGNEPPMQEPESSEEVEESEEETEEEPEPEAEELTEWRTRLVLLDGYDSLLYISDDDGQTWSYWGATPLEGPTKSAMITTEDGAYLLTDTQGAVLFSYNAGESWFSPTTAPWGSDAPNGTSCHHVNLVLGQEGAVYATSTHSQRDGILYRSDDDGANWTQVGTWPHQTGLMHALEVTLEGVIFVAHTPYEGAQVFRSLDGGETFEQVSSYNDSTFGGVALITSDSVGTLYAIGNPESTLYRSFDDGDSWESAAKWEDPRSIASLAITPDDTLVAVSVKGPTLTSTDLGTSLEVVGDWGTVADRDIICCSGWTSLMTEQVPVED